jgi:predicted SAM-dependent methyltransferase
MQEIQDNLGQMLFGKTKTGILKEGGCMRCSEPDLNFRDNLSRKEHTISGMCQKCQDDIFKDPDEEEY